MCKKVNHFDETWFVKEDIEPLGKACERLKLQATFPRMKLSWTSQMSQVVLFAYLVTRPQHNTHLQILMLSRLHLILVLHERFRARLTDVTLQDVENLRVVIKNLLQNFNLTSKARVPNVDGCKAWVRMSTRLFRCRVYSGCCYREVGIGWCFLRMRLVLWWFCYVIFGILHPPQLKVWNIKFIAQEEVAVSFLFQALAELFSVALGEENQYPI